MMDLRDLLAPWMHYDGDEKINDVILDSRQIKPGNVFVAVPGHEADGRKYLDSASENGAIACLIHTNEPQQHSLVNRDNGLHIYIHDLQHKVSALAAQAWPLKADALTLIGITGTNGKTSVSQLIAQLIVLNGHRAAVMGTMGNGEWRDTEPCNLVETGNTTADALTVMRQLHGLQQDGVDACAMEVSSHALVQGRVTEVPFDVAVFTNLSRDHLDYHGDMISYGAAKRRLLDFKSLHTALINLDDIMGQAWYFSNPKRYTGFSTEGHIQARYYVTDIEFHCSGARATLHWPDGQAQFDSPLIGTFNLSNLLAALSALHACGYDMSDLCQLVSQLKSVAGRMECFPAKGKATLVVDYAHTPDGLEQALKAAHIHSDGQLWCVFGCGGDRDTGKRPQMAAVAEEHADKIMLTSDNSRSEQPMAIISDMQAGLKRPELAMVNPERREAIKQVFAQAKAGDIVLLAGKGHETYQEILGVKHDYDERAFAAELAGEAS